MKYTYDNITSVERVHWQYNERKRSNAVIPKTGKTPPRFRHEGGKWINALAKQTGQAKLMLAGDLMCQEGLIEAKRTGSEREDYDFDSSFVYVKQLLQEADLAIGNLESVIHPEAPYATEQLYIGRYYNRNGPPQFLDSLRTAGFDMLVASNNHMVDTGMRGLYRTHEFMSSFGFIHTGSFVDTDEPRFALVDVNGITVGVLSYTLCMNFRTADLLTTDRKWMLNYYASSTARSEIESARNAGADYIICYIHWGTEMVQTINAPQQRVAQELADYGVDYIAGSHPHVVQPYDVITAKDGRRVPVIYSMGNLISHFAKTEPKTSAIIELDLHRLPDGRIAAEDHYVACYTFSEFDGSKYVTVPLVNRVFRTPSVNESMRRRRVAVAKVIGGGLFPSHSFDVPINHTSIPKQECSLHDSILNGDFIVPEVSETQARVLDAFRVTEAFRDEYSAFMLKNRPKGNAVKTAIEVARRLTGDQTICVENNRKLIGDMVYAKYVLGFSYWEFFVYGLVDKTPEECMEYVPESVIMKYYRKLNRSRESTRLLNDKFKSYQAFKDYYKREIIKIAGEEDEKRFLEFCERHGKFIVKPVAASIGKGVRLVDMSETKDAAGLFNELLVSYLLKDKTEFICEELIVQAQTYAQIHPESVNSLRIFTYHDGVEPRVIIAWLKAGQGSAIVDNGSSGGMLAEIDCTAGVVRTSARDEGNNTYDTHPDTGFVFNGFVIEGWEEVVKTVCALAQLLPGSSLIGWDMAMSADKGWQVVEGNAYGMFNVVQVATQKGMRRQFLKDVEWDLRKNT